MTGAISVGTRLAGAKRRRRLAHTRYMAWGTDMKHDLAHLGSLGAAAELLVFGALIFIVVWTIVDVIEIWRR